jgi:hypothetical protein
MRTKLMLLLAIATVGPSGMVAAQSQAVAPPASHTPWRLSGDLTEACTCSVPCTCNFGQSPSPHHFCWALWSLGIHKGRYAKVKLDGLRLAFAQGAKGIVTYTDDRATPEQAAALRAISNDIQAKERALAQGAEDPTMHDLGARPATIVQEVGPKSNRLQIGDRGGFEADYILGFDGKTPVVVENNTSWNMRRAIKAKTKRLHYKDDLGNEFDFTDTNSNQGEFDWSDKTPVYLR